MSKIKNICITSYYGLRDSLLSAALSLTKIGQNIFDYQLLSEKNINPDYKNNFVNYIKNNKIDVILWWFISIPTADMEYIVKNTNVKNIYFNWDEPHNWKHVDMENKAKFFDCVFVCSEEKLDKYLELGAKNACWLLPGYDARIIKVLEDDNLANGYDCDISFICTNLYENQNDYPDQIINRKKLIDDIYNGHVKNKYVFHIYGPEFLKEKYPLSYKGYITYDNQNLLFNKSKINLCTHVMGCASKYLNERAIMIAGAGGLLLVDKIKNLNDVFEINKECLTINTSDVQGQITSILKNYDDYIDVRVNLKEKSMLYSWDAWANTIYEKFISKS